MSGIDLGICTQKTLSEQRFSFPFCRRQQVACIFIFSSPPLYKTLFSPLKQPGHQIPTRFWPRDSIGVSQHLLSAAVYQYHSFDIIHQRWIRFEMLALCVCKRMKAIKYRQIATCCVNDVQTTQSSSVSPLALSQLTSISEAVTATLNKHYSFKGRNIFQNTFINQIFATYYIFGSAARTIATESLSVDVKAEESSSLQGAAIWQSSTMKKRRMKMNKHKLKKRKKSLRMNTKISRS